MLVESEDVPTVPKSRWSNPYQIVGVALLLLGAVAMAYGHSMWGSLAVLASVGLVRKAQWSISNASGSPRFEVGPTPLQRPGRGLWIASGVVLILWLLSLQALYSDARHGYHEVWPLYVLTGVVVVAVGVWGALAAKLVR
jgi:hypothetical protein